MESERNITESGVPAVCSSIAARLDAALAVVGAIEDELKAIADIQKGLLRARTEQEVAHNLTDALVHNFGAYFARVWLVRTGDRCGRCQLAEHCPNNQMCLHLVASSGFYTHVDGGHARVPLGTFKIGLIAQGRGKTISNDVAHDDRVHNHEWVEQLGLQSFAGFPIVINDRVVGVMAMFSRSKLCGHLLITLELLADLAASALENVRRVELERQLECGRKLETVGQLAAGIAHEINSPMQFISDNFEYINGCTHRLVTLLEACRHAVEATDSPCDWDKRRQMFQDLAEEVRFEEIKGQLPAAVADGREGVRRVIDIVRAMRQFSYSAAEELVQTDLNEAIRNTLLVTRSRWSEVADVETALDPALTVVPAFPSEISQVLLNLIVNAADAIEEKLGSKPAAKGRISIRTVASAEHAIVEVQDTGCGIPENIRPRIFDPFFTTKEVGKGRGQGLNVCHDVVVNKHHGSIEFDTTPNAGTCFRVKLPRTTLDYQGECSIV